MCIRDRFTSSNDHALSTLLGFDYVLILGGNGSSVGFLAKTGESNVESYSKLAIVPDSEIALSLSRVDNNKFLISTYHGLMIGTASYSSSTCQSHNVWGYAWSENIGWVSFSCKNCDQDNNGYVDTNCGGDNSTILSVDYGVDICIGNPDQDPEICSGKDPGTLVGYAWSEHIGWISFNESDLAGCPQSPCKAWVDPSTGTVYGWAKALAANDPQSGGWEGWIHLQGSNYGVFIDTSSTPAEFEGWAWGEDVLGWISFNCDNPESGNVCSQSDYKVYTTYSFNSPPVVQNPHISSEDYCVSETTGKITFEWTYSDPDNDNQSRFDLIVSSVYNINPESIPNPEVNLSLIHI